MEKELITPVAKIMRKLALILTLLAALIVPNGICAAPQNSTVAPAELVSTKDSGQAKLDASTIAVAQTDSAVAQTDSSAQTTVKAGETEEKHILQFLYDMADEINYFYVVLLMTVESSFIPFPSEVVVPPAGFMAAEGNMNIILVIIFATLGSLLGAFINYFLSLWLGRKIVYKFANSKLGHIFLLSEKKVQKAEAYFDKHGAIATLIGRLVPAVRQLISIPAGLAKMGILKFTIYTGIGAALWNTVLALLGYYLHSVVGSKEELKAVLSEYEKPIVIVICGIAVLAVAYIVYQTLKDNRAKSKEQE